MMMTNDPDQLVELTIFEHEFTARLLAARLEDQEIPAEVFALAGEQLGLLSAATVPHSGAQIRVRASDFDRAQIILDEFNDESQHGDDNNSDAEGDADNK